jgi:hypothetical protein
MGRPRALAAGGALWLVAADAPVARYGAVPIERGLRDLEWVSRCAVAHEAVVEHVGRSGPVVPMKLFTLFSSDARAVGHIRPRRRRLERVLARVAGCQEWGVRVSLDPARAAALARPASRGATSRLHAGTRFLLRKRDEQAAHRRLAARARADVQRAFRELTRLARDARRRPPLPVDGQPVALLDAAYLVPATRVTRFRTAVGQIARRLGSRGCAVTLTGPWPPYNFVGR